MATQRGVDDSARLARIDRMMAEDPSMTERRAILVLDPGDGITRRLQKKLQNRRGEQAAALRASATAAHAQAWPVRCSDDAERFELIVRVPAADHGVTGDVVDLTVTVEPARGLLCNVAVYGPRWTVERYREHGPVTPDNPYPGSLGALRALGVPPVDLDGVLTDPTGPSDAVTLLAAALCSAWKAAGVADADGLLDEAVVAEEGRLRGGGLSRLVALMGEDGRRIGAAYASAPVEALSAVLVPGADAARRAVLRELASYGGTDLAVFETDLVASHVGQPLELLARVLQSRRAGPGREVTSVDVTWLHAVVGRRALAPVPVEVVAALLRLRGAVDPARCASDADAAGLVHVLREALASPLARRAGPDAALDLTMRRLATGPDATLPYGAVASSLRAAGPGALAAVTSGVESLCARVVSDLLVPTLVADAVARDRVDPVVFGRHLVAALDGPVWRARLAGQARDMVEAGRTVADLAAAVARAPGLDLSAPAHEVSQRAVQASVSACTGLLSRSSDLDAAWEALSPAFVPRWRMGGRTAWSDRCRDLLREVRLGNGGAAGAVRRGLRTIVDRVEAGLGVADGPSDVPVLERLGLRHAR